MSLIKRDILGRFVKGNNYRGGFPKCLDCGKTLGDYRSEYCRKCAQKHVKRKDNSGKNNPMYGRPMTEEHKDKLKLIHAQMVGIKAPNWRGGKSKKYKKCIDCNGSVGDHYAIRCRKCWSVFCGGSNSPSWRGGVSFEPYSIKFNKRLKEEIRNRDRLVCQLCGITEEDHLAIYNRVLCIHHIDYKKKNCRKDNLITLCMQCNIRANFNRDYWYAYFKYIVDTIEGKI